MNLHQVKKYYCKNKGLRLEEVKSYTRQILISLVVFKKSKIIHADIKLDNILVTSDLRKVKLCDFGTVFYI